MKQDGQDEANVSVHRLSLNPENLVNLGNPAWIYKIKQTFLCIVSLQPDTLETR